MLNGKELKIKRIILDIKAISVAEHLNIHKSYVSKMENCVQDIPKHLYDKWVKFLGVEDNDLLNN